MEQLMGLIGQEYIIITLLGVVVGYVVTTTPKLEKFKDNIPIMVAVLGSIIGGVQQSFTLEGFVYGAVAGLISTGLYELFGKRLKELGEDEKDEL